MRDNKAKCDNKQQYKTDLQVKKNKKNAAQEVARLYRR